MLVEKYVAAKKLFRETPAN